MVDYVSLLGVKGGPAIRPGSNMPSSTLIHIDGKNLLVDAGWGSHDLSVIRVLNFMI